MQRHFGGVAMIIAQVRVNVSTSGVDKDFSYRVPEELNFLTAGWQVVACKDISEALQ